MQYFYLVIMCFQCQTRTSYSQQHSIFQWHHTRYYGV